MSNALKQIYRQCPARQCPARQCPARPLFPDNVLHVHFTVIREAAEMAGERTRACEGLWGGVGVVQTCWSWPWFLASVKEAHEGRRPLSREGRFWQASEDGSACLFSRITSSAFLHRSFEDLQSLLTKGGKKKGRGGGGLSCCTTLNRRTAFSGRGGTHLPSQRPEGGGRRITNLKLDLAT